MAERLAVVVADDFADAAVRAECVRLLAALGAVEVAMDGLMRHPASHVLACSAEAAAAVVAPIAALGLRTPEAVSPYWVHYAHMLARLGPDGRPTSTLPPACVRALFTPPPRTLPAPRAIDGARVALVRAAQAPREVVAYMADLVRLMGGRVLPTGPYELVAYDLPPEHGTSGARHVPEAVAQLLVEHARGAPAPRCVRFGELEKMAREWVREGAATAAAAAAAASHARKERARAAAAARGRAQPHIARTQVGEGANSTTPPDLPYFAARSRLPQPAPADRCLLYTSPSPRD